ncbi:GTP 3',8-cyclase [subsurface metagenome]
MEWSTVSKYNSFNSYKGLTYYENYKQIVKWLDGDSYLPAPIECNLDPMAECNLRCYFCITQRYLRNQREEVGPMRKLPLSYMLELVDFLAEWGVRGLCISGGGEPTLHPDLPELMNYAKDKMGVAVATNATNPIDELLYCQWVSLSIDASNKRTYKKVKGKDKFDDVCGNIQKLTNLRKEMNSTAALCFKFLILPENQYEIYEACKLAKNLGVQDFHARPVDFERPDIVGAHPLPINIPLVQRQFELCHELETEDFHVYTITHKFDANFHVKYDYPACLAAPILLPVLTDGNSYICVEHKMEEKYRLGSAYPDPYEILTWWGSDKHRQMIKNIVPSRDCSRCIYSSYHQQIKEVVQDDKMCIAFP